MDWRMTGRPSGRPRPGAPRPCSCCLSFSSGILRKERRNLRSLHKRQPFVLLKEMRIVTIILCFAGFTAFAQQPYTSPYSVKLTLSPKDLVGDLESARGEIKNES